MLPGSSYLAHSSYTTTSGELFYCLPTESEFINIFKCNLAESASARFQFNCHDSFNDKTLYYRHLDHFSGLLKFIEESLHKTKTVACRSPVVLSDL